MLNIICTKVVSCLCGHWGRVNLLKMVKIHSPALQKMESLLVFKKTVSFAWCVLFKNVLIRIYRLSFYDTDIEAG